MLVVDDHPVVCEGVVTQLSRYSDIEVVAHAEDADSAVRECAVHRLEVVLLDLRLPDVLAADVVPRLIEVSPHSRVLLFTAFPDHTAVAPSLAAGACGLLVREAFGRNLHDALRKVARTGSYRTSGSATTAAPVTPREYDVLRLVASGHTNGEIGEQLGLSLNTVKSYLHNVMHKLGARNRAQVTTRAPARGLLCMDRWRVPPLALVGTGVAPRWWAVSSWGYLGTVNSLVSCSGSTPVPSRSACRP
ncbi:response regulator transcription factor [Spirillospora sp. CA-255316]